MNRYARWLVVSTVYLGCAQFAFLSFIQRPGVPDEFAKARLTALVDGTAHSPFVYRTFFPTTIRLISRLMPESLRDNITAWSLRSKPVQEIFASTPAVEERAPFIYLLAYALEFLSVVGFALVLRASLRYFYGTSCWLTDLIPAIAVASLPIFYRYISYDYDLPKLFVFSWALLLLARRNWRWFYPMLVVCGLTKETAIVLVLIHLLAHGSTRPRRTFWIHVAAQVGILAMIRGCLQFIVFADAPGLPVETWPQRNWDMLTDPSRWGFLFFHFSWAGRSSMIIPTNYNLIFLLFVPLVVWRWSDKPLFLRRALWTLPALLVLMFFFAYIDEMRDYLEAYPIVVLLVGHTLLNAKPSQESALCQAPLNGEGPPNP